MSREMLISIVVTILFVIFAAVQLNDADGWIWVAAYLIVAGFVMLGRRFQPLVRWGVVLIYLVAFGLYMPDVFRWFSDGMPSITGSMKAESPYIELVREGGGLLICLLTLISYSTYWSRKDKCGGNG